MKGLVSVIITTYNRPKFLEEAIQSVLSQTYLNVEIIIVDDGSQNNEAKIIASHIEDCRYFYKNNEGISSARNFGIEKARGEFIAFLDDDDMWLPKKIEIQLQCFDRDSSIDLVHSGALIMNRYGELTGEQIGASKAKEHLRSGNVFWNALGSWTVKSPTPLIKSSVFESGIRFDQRLNAGEDTDFYTRLFFNYKVMYLAEPLAKYRVYNDLNRLSLGTIEYLKVEYVISDNLRSLCKNVYTRYKINLRLAKSSKKRLREYSLSPKILIFFSCIYYIFPFWFIYKVYCFAIKEGR